MLDTLLLILLTNLHLNSKHICRTTQKNVQASQCKLNKDRLFVLYVLYEIMIDMKKKNSFDRLPRWEPETERESEYSH